MNLPDAPIAYAGYFATHFFTVSDLDRSKALKSPSTGSRTTVNLSGQCFGID
jgi:hypothetical protein